MKKIKSKGERLNWGNFSKNEVDKKFKYNSEFLLNLKKATPVQIEQSRCKQYYFIA